jgi:phage baseplate assembly protein W
MQGMSRNDGKPLSGTDHIRQSVQDILTTPLGSRVMLTGYGSGLHKLVDHPENSITAVRVVMATALALSRWEPRITVDGIDVVKAGAGTILVSIRATDIENQRAIFLENIRL